MSHNSAKIKEVAQVLSFERVQFYGAVIHTPCQNCNDSLKTYKFMFLDRNKTFKLCLKCLKKRFKEGFKLLEKSNKTNGGN